MSLTIRDFPADPIEVECKKCGRNALAIGLVIAVVASTGAYFLVPPPSSASASDCATREEVQRMINLSAQNLHNDHHTYLATLSDDINWLNRNSYMIAGLTQALIDAGVISKDAKINPD